MRLLLMVGLCFSVSGWASDEDVKAHESKLSSAKKWSQVEENLKVWIPGSVVKEFATAVHEKPYPKIRKLKYGLQLIQEDGLRVTIQLKSNGRISFNGKDWRFKPLLPIDQQVSQLAMFLSGDQKRAGLELVSSANASGDVDDDAYGAAAFAFAAANAWKADACDEANLTDELIEDCTLMAVAMRMEFDGWKKKAQRAGLFGEVRRASVDTGKDAGGMYPVKLKCPNKRNNGTLELISKSTDGWAGKYLIKLIDGKPTLVQSFIAEPGANFQEMSSYKFSSGLSSKELDLAKMAAKKGLLLNEQICNGNQSARDRYLSALISNSEFIRSATYKNEDNEDTDKKSVESTQ